MVVVKIINTVTGSIKKEDLGVTLAHEHLNWNSKYAQFLYFDKLYAEKQIQDLEEIYESILPVFKELYNQGCRAVVETSPPRGGQNLMLMQRLSEASGVKIIPNTGLVFTRHVYQIHKKGYAEALAERWIEDFKEGLDELNGILIRPAYIKILLPEEDSLPEVDREILKAAVIASNKTGLPIHCHILGAEAAEEVMDFLEEQNFDYNRFLWAHAGHEDNEAWDKTRKRAVSKKMWLGFDGIQKDKYDRYLRLLKEALDGGYSDKILISQDYDFYEQVVKAGNNHPCASIFTDFIPFCEENGLSKDKIIEIMTENPAEYYNID